MKLKNSNCNKTQRVKCDEAQKLKMLLNSKTKIVMKLKKVKL